MRLTVYTTIIGKNTDPLLDPAIINQEVDYLCFTDRKVESKWWKIIPIESSGPPCRQSRRIKILSHKIAPEADVSLWLDASFRLLCDPVTLANAWMDRSDVVAFKHPDRKNIRQEGNVIAGFGLATKEQIDAQVQRYREAGFLAEEQPHITSSGFCMRRHTPEVIGFNTLWWKMFKEAGHFRDQMSIDYALSQSNVRISHFDGHYRDNPYAKFHPESKEVRERRKSS